MHQALRRRFLRRLCSFNQACLGVIRKFVTFRKVFILPMLSQSRRRKWRRHRTVHPTAHAAHFETFAQQFRHRLFLPQTVQQTAVISGIHFDSCAAAAAAAARALCLSEFLGRIWWCQRLSRRLVLVLNRWTVAAGLPLALPRSLIFA